MTLSVTAIYDAMVSYSQALGVFDAVITHEPKTTPGSLTTAIWLQALAPAPNASGLSATSTRLEFLQRLYVPMTSEPQDAIDPRALEALDAIMAAYTGGFTLGGLVRDVDCLGAHGVALSAKAGYLTADGKVFRVIDVTVPLIVNDLWTQAE